MNNEGQQILALQEVENDLRDRIAEFKRVRYELESPSPSRAALKSLREAEAAEQEARRRQRTINDEWQAVLAKIDGEETQLYSGNVKNPKELTNLQLEVESLKKRRATLEEQAILLITEVDDLAHVTETLRNDYDSIQGESESQQEDMAKRANELKREINELRRQREKLLSEVSSALLDQYRYVQRLKNDTHAVAELRDGICGACHVQVSASKQNSVERIDHIKIETCGNCGRILVG